MSKDSTMDLNGFNMNLFSKEQSWIRPTFCSWLVHAHNGHTFPAAVGDSSVEGRGSERCWKVKSLDSLESFSGVIVFLMIVIIWFLPLWC